MSHETLRRWCGIAAGAAALVAGSFLLGQRAQAQQPPPAASGRPNRTGRLVAPQPGATPAPGPGFSPGREGFAAGGGGGFPGGFDAGGYRGGPPMPHFPPPGGSALAATPTTVYVLQGGSLYAFDAKSLHLITQARIPGPGGPGGPPPPGFGGGGGIPDGPAPQFDGAPPRGAGARPR
jgi:hypothetical protein